MSPSSTVENYLKAIYHGTSTLAPPQRLLPMGQVASALDIAPGTATTMVKTLAESGLVEYEPYAGVRLTPAGEHLAALVLRRHRLVELFLVQVMGLRWDEVHDEAELLEHVVSERLIDRIDEMLGRPEVDPHGDPIPNAEGIVKPQEAQSLLTCPLHVPVTVTRILDQDKTFLQFVEGHDLKPGEMIEVEARDAPSDSVRLRGRNAQPITIGTRAASKLLVHVAALIMLLGVAAPLWAQGGARDAHRPWEIVDNSFLVEEAFNQDRNTFQNALTATVDRAGDWQTTFTQEWAAFSHAHQVSYTLAYERATGRSGIGDTAIHYRYQLRDEAPGRPAISPRVSVLFLGDDPEQARRSSVGWQAALPVSQQAGNLYFHGNVGVSRTNSTQTPTIGGSLIWRTRPMLNLLVEGIATWPPAGGIGESRTAEVTWSPGLRAGWNRRNAQTVAGVALPVTRTASATHVAVFVYLSYERPFTTMP